MSKLPVISDREMHEILTRLGFEAVRQKGSHVRYRHADGRVCTVPNHGLKTLFGLLSGQSSEILISLSTNTMRC